MAAQSHTKPRPPATPPRTASLTISAISSRLKHMMMQRKNTTAPEADHAKSPPSQTISTSASSSGSSSGYASSSSSSAGPSSGFSPTSGLVSASSSGSESPPRLKRLASSRKGILSLLERMVASASNSGKKRDLKGKGAETEAETGEVEYILFDGEGNPAYCPGSKYKFMGNLK